MSGHNVSCEWLCFMQAKLCWIRTGRLASGTLSFRPVQIHGHRGLAAPTGHGDSVIRLVGHVWEAQNQYFLLNGQTKIYLIFWLPGWTLVLQINICILSYFINKSDRSSFDCYFSHTFCKNN